jgi:hypothetical protein
MLNGKSRSGETPKALKMKAAENTPVEHSDLSQGKDQDTFNVRSSGQKLLNMRSSPYLSPYHRLTWIIQATKKYIS